MNFKFIELSFLTNKNIRIILNIKIKINDYGILNFPKI